LWDVDDARVSGDPSLVIPPGGSTEGNTVATGRTTPLIRGVPKDESWAEVAMQASKANTADEAMIGGLLIR
jgi:hypothetical protein